LSRGRKIGLGQVEGLEALGGGEVAAFLDESALSRLVNSMSAVLNA
jgi:hypothetical protein